MTQSTAQVVNFGGNVRFTPEHRYAPRSEPELLEILNRHRQGKIRVVASRHSWSDAIVSEEALVDLRHFCSIRTFEREGRTFATVGGGCQIKHLLERLNAQGLTTPSVGLITEQTIAGAISTGTHGSGKHSLSHYISSLRIACYTADGSSAVIREVDGGVELRAARCGLGCLGVIVDVTFACIPQYYVREKLTPCDSLHEALARQQDAPLQQFYLVPHLWRYYAQERAVDQRGQASRTALLYRWYWFLSLDLGLHLLIKLFAAVLRSPWLIRLLYRRLLPASVFSRWVVVDRSDRMLVMEHELFRHLELELFVPASQLAPAAQFVCETLQVADGVRSEVSEEVRAGLVQLGQLAALLDLQDTYCHHYVICIRRVLADDTLISMSCGDDECWYALSLITYVQPREPFYRVARFLATSTARLFRARLHWGKWFPLGADEVRSMYPNLDDFRAVCAQFDPRQVFANRFVTAVLGLPTDQNPAESRTDRDMPDAEA